jgi:hypothetical protein
MRWRWRRLIVGSWEDGDALCIGAPLSAVQ